MKKIELYIDENNKLILIEKDSNNNRINLLLKEKEAIQYLDKISINKLENIYEYSEYDIVLKYDDSVIYMRDYKKLFYDKKLNCLRDSIRLYQESKALSKIKKNKITRKNKHTNKKVIATGLTLLTIISSYVVMNVPKSLSASDKLENFVVYTSSENVEQEKHDQFEIQVNYQMKEEYDNTQNEKEVISINYEDRSSEDKACKTKAYYGELINKYAKMYGLDPSLVCGVATQERGIHSSEIDKGGAIGLMQIQKSVWDGSEICAYNFETKTCEKFIINGNQLGDISYNIKVGCMVLQNSMEYMNYNIPAALQCYNMGYGNMRKILYQYSLDSGQSVEDILNDCKNIGWLEYRDMIMQGDQEYIEHVLSWIGSDINLIINKIGGDQINLNINNEMFNKKIY